MRFRRNASLRPYNTLALAAHATAFVGVSSDADLVSALEWARKRHLPVVPLGEGSNVVLAGDLNALVIRQETRGIRVINSGNSSVTLHVAAGENWHELVRWCLQQGYYGFENLALIPGTVGAAPIQNIGAYGVELQSFVVQVHGRKIADGQRVTLSRGECEFGYRDSVFKHSLQDKLVITAVELQLPLHPDVHTAYPALANYFEEPSSIDVTPQAVFDAVVSIRRSKLPDPALEPNVGSFFKNPTLQKPLALKLAESYPALPCYPQENGNVKVSAAWLIEDCGWKGVNRDSVGVHGQHALVLVNHGNGSGGQLLSLASDIAASVYEKFDIHLEVEPRVYGARP